MKPRKQTTWKGQVPPPTKGGQYHSISNVQIKAEPAYSVFNEQSETWMRWDNQKETMSIQLKGRMYEIDPTTIMKRHPMDVGAGTTNEPADLKVIRQRYEHALANNPTLRAIREEYDDLLQKYDILKAIEGEDDDAKI